MKPTNRDTKCYRINEIWPKQKMLYCKSEHGNIRCQLCYKHQVSQCYSVVFSGLSGFVRTKKQLSMMFTLMLVELRYWRIQRITTLQCWCTNEKWQMNFVSIYRDIYIWEYDDSFSVATVETISIMLWGNRAQNDTE